MEQHTTYTAFEGSDLLFRGSLHEVVTKIKKRMGKTSHSEVFLFSDETGKLMDFNFHGTEKDVQKRLEVFSTVPERQGEEESKSLAGPGRPKLGVISREVSLLPRHWEWLAAQPSGASATLRKLIEEAKKKSAGGASLKQLQERCYKVMSVLAGDRSGYEEALRALYKKDQESFLMHINDWPKDIRKHIAELAQPVFGENS